MRITIRLLTPDDYDTAQEIGQSAFGPSATIGDTIRIAQNSQPEGNRSMVYGQSSFALG